MKKYSDSISLQQYYKIVIKKYFNFVVVYSAIWSIPNIGKILELHYNPETLPFWLIVMIHVGIGSAGIGNGIVWICNSQNESDNETTYVNMDHVTTQSTDMSTDNVYNNFPFQMKNSFESTSQRV